jgi:23S rRNA (adenine2503-C2)-methyltransferase
MSAVNLLDFDLEGLTAFCEQLGEKRFRATQLFRWIHQKGATDFDQMSDLAKSLRSKLKGVATLQDLSVISEHVSIRRHHQVAVRCGRRQRRRERLHPRVRPSHAVRVLAGRLRGGMSFLLDRPSGLQRNLTTGEIVAQLWHAEHTLRKRLGT